MARSAGWGVSHLPYPSYSSHWSRTHRIPLIITSLQRGVECRKCHEPLKRFFGPFRHAGAPTKRLNEQVKRNAARFPADFLFRLTTAEFKTLRSQLQALANRSQIATDCQKHRDLRLLP